MALGELAEQIGTANYKLGIVVGHEIVARKLNKMAGEAFKKGRDKLAITYRNLAQEIHEMAHNQQNEYDLEWRTKCEEAFVILDKLDKDNKPDVKQGRP